MVGPRDRIWLSVTKLDVLNLISSDDFTVVEVADELGVSLSTARRCIRWLVERGLASKGEAKGGRPSFRASQTGRSVERLDGPQQPTRRT